MEIRKLPAGIKSQTAVSFSIKTTVQQKQQVVSAETGVWTRLDLYHCMFTAGAGGEFLTFYFLDFWVLSLTENVIY